MEKFVRVSIDGIHINARHYVSKGKKDGAKAMLEDGVAKNQKWANDAWNKCKEEVDIADTPDEAPINNYPPNVPDDKPISNFL